MNDLNLEGQTKVVNDNLMSLLTEGKIHETFLADVPVTIIETLRSRYRTLNIPLSGYQMQDVQGYFQLQKCIGALILLRREGYDFNSYSGDTYDLYEVAEDHIREKNNGSTEVSMVFPKMVDDAIKAIETGGIEPPLIDMQRVKQYHQQLVAEAL